MAREAGDVNRAWMLAGLGAVAALAVALGLRMRGPRVPGRPAGVPAAAEWAGAGPSGRFFLVRGREGSVFRIEAYAAPSGAREPAAAWRLVGFARAALAPDEIAGMEGGAILLKDGSKLLPAE